MKEIKPRIKKKYFVHYGPDHYHIIHVKAFNLLRKAKNFIDTTNPGAYRLTSQDFKSAWSVGENERILKIKKGIIK